MTEEEALKTYEARKGKENPQDEAPEPKTRKTNLPQDKVLNLPRKIAIGELMVHLKAFPIKEAKAVQTGIWDNCPPAVLSSALSRGKGIDPIEAAAAYGRMIGIEDPEDATEEFRRSWRALSLSQEALLPLFATSLAMLGCDPYGEALPADAIQEALEGQELSLLDAVELLQSIFDICGGFPGDIRDRF